MNYLLAVITHGSSTTIDAAVAAFTANATPPPADAVVYHDTHSEGFCVNTRRAWRHASRRREPFVFWLEHDFLLTRPVDLTKLAGTLERHPRLAQMQLMRNAVNATETAAGGLYESRPDAYTRRGGWLEHTAYLTTNPTLMRRGFMQTHPWPPYPEQCEGRFGIDVVNAGYSFGVWGDGTPWCRHVGVRDGHGY